MVNSSNVYELHNYDFGNHNNIPDTIFRSNMADKLSEPLSYHNI